MQRLLRHAGAVLLVAAVAACSSNGTPASLPPFVASPPGVSSGPTTTASLTPTTAPATSVPTTTPATTAPATSVPTTAPATSVPTTAPATSVPTTAPATTAPATPGAITSQPTRISFPTASSGCPASYYSVDLTVAEPGYSGAYTAVSQNPAEVNVAPRSGYRDQFIATAPMGGAQATTSILVSDTNGSTLSVTVAFNEVCL